MNGDGATDSDFPDGARVGADPATAAMRAREPTVAGVNYLGRSATTILAGGGGEVLLSS
jgi:hypothetical protein